MMTGFDASVKN